MSIFEKYQELTSEYDAMLKHLTSLCIVKSDLSQSRDGTWEDSVVRNGKIIDVSFGEESVYVEFEYYSDRNFSNTSIALDKLDLEKSVEEFTEEMKKQFAGNIKAREDIRTQRENEARQRELKQLEALKKKYEGPYDDCSFVGASLAASRQRLGE